VDAAPTKLIREGVLDFLFAGVSIAVQQSLCGHDHAIQAVAALTGLLVDERRLQRVRLLKRTQSLKSGDLVFPDVPQSDRACSCEFSAYDRGARATLPETASELWAAQSEIVPERVQERGIRSGVHQMWLTVDANSM